MSDDVLDRIGGRSLLRAGPGEQAETEDLGCFGWLRGVRERAVMLELRKKDGHVLAIGYAWIDRVEYSPDTGITLHCSGRRITITGSGLNAEARPRVRLLDGIVRHRVPWVRESEATRVPVEVGGSVIEAIEW